MSASNHQPLIDARGLSQQLEQFAAQRNWQRFHSPKNLVMALTGEVGELNDIFQWLTEEESRHAGRNARTATAVREELADVLMYLVRLASVLDIDLDEAVREKLAVNARKYPIDKASGRADKYDRLDDAT